MSFWLKSLMIFFFLFLLMKMYHFSFWKNSKEVSRVWISSFECGFMSSSIKYKSFSKVFILYLVLFMLFDLEVSLFLNSAIFIDYYVSFLKYYMFLLTLTMGLALELKFGYIGWDL